MCGKNANNMALRRVYLVVILSIGSTFFGVKYDLVLVLRSYLFPRLLLTAHLRETCCEHACGSTWNPFVQKNE